MSAAAIATDHLTKRYGSARGIEDVAFEVGVGQVFGFLGPNGAGKTTTIRTLMGFLRPTSGVARLFGVDVGAGGAELRRRTGFLAGDVSLYPRFTGEELFGYLGALRGSVDAAYRDALIERFTVDPSRRIEDLSHGNQQKIGLVQAFMHRPELVILDEPTQGLDPLVQQTFHELVDETREDGRTVLISSHVLSEVERLCDEVGIIREGRIVVVEGIEDLRARAFRRVHIRFADEVPAAELAAIDGVGELVIDGPDARCTMTGPIDPLVKLLAAHDVIDLVTERPSLEEAFLTYYGGTDAP
jgi:ABC-2 type transport system ATP-binding protein